MNHKILSTKKTFHFLLLLTTIIIFSHQKGIGQSSTANYTFTANTNGTLTDMSTGTTTLIGPDVDGLNTGTFSIANDIGFTFYFMGSGYSQFVVTEDGVIRFGSSLTPINRVPEIDVDEPRLIPFSCDMRTGNNGKVHYKVTGSSPNQVFTIEWSNMIIAYPLNSQAGNSTFQIQLYETSNLIEYVYGYMYADVHRTGQEDYGAIGFSNTNALNGKIFKTGTFTDNSIDRTLVSSTILPSLITSVGEISGLSSTSDGYRMLYKFTPVAPPTAPTNLTFTGITQNSITVGWTDNSSNESYFLLYRSEDGGSTYELVATNNAGITSATIGGLPSKSYRFKVVAVNEGGVSSALIGDTSTLAAGSKVSNVASGAWNDPNSWSPVGVPASTDNVTILNTHTITVGVTSAVCNNLTVGEGTSGILHFIGGTTSATLTADGDITVASGGTFDIVSGATGGTRKLIIGNRTRANSNLTVNGTFDLSNGGSSVANVEFKGSSNGTISGTGPTCDFYSITLNKGSNNTPVLEATRVITLTAPLSAGNRLTLTNGTFKLSSASTLEPYFGTQTIIGATGRLWINNSGAGINCVGTGVSSTGAGNATITSGGILQITSGTFGYGSGSNTLTINGTLKLESPSATLNQYGKLLLPNGGYLIMPAGNINLDPRAVNDLADNAFVFGTTAFALITGGTVTIVDPPASSSYVSFFIPSAGESNKNFIGSTLRLGDGISTTAGSANGFVISTPTQYVLSLGNIDVNNPSGSNRFVSMLKTDGNSNHLMLQNLNITAGTFRLYNTSGTAQTINVFGNVTNSSGSTLDASVSGNRIQFMGSSAQNYSGTGSISATNNLEIQINNVSGVTLNAPLTALNLILTNGKLTTTSTNLLTLLSTSTTGCGLPNSYVNGPLKRILPGGTNTITFPIGKGTYNMIELVNGITTAANVEVTAEVFDSNCGGSYSNDPYILNTNRYWNLSVAANSGNFTSSYVRITEVGTTTGEYLTKSNTVNGTYTNFSDGVGGGYTILSNATITNSPTSYYFVVASNYLTGTYNVGSGEAYTSFSGATGGLFAAINATGLRGNVTVNVTSNITETGEVALNQWNEANGSGHLLSIQPSAASLRTISGSVNKTSAGGPGAMIRINGADRVTFNGNFSGTGNYLVFKNNTTNAGHTSPTFQIDNGATNFTISNCAIENHNNSTSTQGTITLGSGTNRDVILTGNEIRNATTGNLKYPYCAIYSNNSNNGSITISNNSIYNFGNYGIYLATVGNNVTLSGNHFYKTLTDDLSAISQTVIYLNGGYGHTITGNYIGGQAINIGGSAWTNNAGSSNIKGIVLNVGTSLATSVQNNTIGNFNVQSTSGTVFTGIEITEGAVNVGTTSGNTLSNITTLATNVYGINSSVTNSIVIANNSINTINANSTGSSTVLNGIRHSGTASANISANTIYGLNCGGTSISLNKQTVSGIYCSGTSNQPLIHNNNIYNIRATNTGTVQTNASGICINSATSAKIYKNKIYGIKNASTGTSATAPPTASGIVLYNPETGAEISNNVIALGYSETSNIEFNGIWLNSQPTNSSVINIYYNSVVVDGTVSSGSLPTFALLRGNNSTTSLTNFVVDARNNILANRRNGGTGKHYTSGNQGSNPATGWGSNASNYNILLTVTSANMGLWNTTDCNVANWKTNATSDNNSYYYTSTTGTSDGANLNLTNLFTDIATGNLSILTANPESWTINGTAQQLSSVTNDYLDNARSFLITNGASDCGAYEVTPSATPFAVSESGTIGDGSTTTYTLGMRPLGSITWHGSTFPTITMRYYPGTNPADDNDNTLASTTHSNSYWNISATGGDINNYTYDLTLYYDDNILYSITDESVANIVKNPVIYPFATSTPLTVWRTYNATANDAATNFVTISGIIGFSDFALEAGLIPMPVQLIGFNAFAQDGIVELSWATASETNNDYFTIEKSKDLLTWNSLIPIKGAGNSYNILNYFQTDNHPFPGRSYYRLKQTDFDGKYSYSDIKSVSISTNLNSFFNYYYKEIGQQLIIENQSGLETDAQIEVYNIIPVHCQTKKMHLVEGYNAFDLSILPSGIYFAVINTSMGTSTTRFVKP